MRMRKLIAWANQNLLFLASLFLLAFIPLYPKLPLLDVLPGYIVRVRIEDFLVLLTGVIWLRDLKAKRILWNTSYFWFVLIYGVVGLLSIFVGVFFLSTIPFQLLHIGKSALNLFRYLEYYTLFFFFFSSLQTKKQLQAIVWVIAFTLVGVVAYGLGQVYLRFPVYSTMNREYSKGEVLYLDQGARPQSTFAGHYDLAAYLVIILPLIFSLILGKLREPLNGKGAAVIGGLATAFGLGVVMLLLTDSKTSIAACGAGLILVFTLHWLKLSHKNRIRWLVVAIILSALGIVGFWRYSPPSLKAKLVSAVHKLQPSKSNEPTDLVGDGYETKVIKTAQPDGTVKSETVRVKSTWSPNALKYGLSMGIRLDTLWPQALLGFVRSPLTGSGYGTLAMLDTNLFQEADSTDNNYLRTLGETGLLGLLAFYGIILLILKEAWHASRRGDALSNRMAVGLCGSVVGLLLAAVYLDVFAASKVAFVFWALSGAILKSADGGAASLESLKRVLGHLKKYWPLYVGTVFFFVLLQQNPFMPHTPTKDLAEYTSGLQQITAARCFLREGFLGLCRNSGLHLSPQTSVYALLLLPFLRLFKLPGIFAYLNLLLIGSPLLLTYFVIRERAQARNIFMGILSALSIASALSLSGLPLDMARLLLTLLGLPAIAIGVVFLLERLKSSLAHPLRLVLCITFVAILANTLISGNLFNRLRNIDPNEAFTSVERANGILDSKPEAPAYLATVLDPYFVDMYTLDKYAVLPLSQTQPYMDFQEKVWGIPNGSNLHDLYSSLLESNAKIYLSDYGTYQNKTYRDSFNAVKQTFDLSYVDLGCNERCNLYSLFPANNSRTSTIHSWLNGLEIRDSERLDAYKFAVISNRFDSELASSEMDAQPLRLLQQLTPFLQKKLDFMIISGDISLSPNNGQNERFETVFSDQVGYPVLFSAGNMDMKQDKGIRSGYQEFFTASQYFILLEADASSHISISAQLAFYNSLLKIEKLPRIKSLFIISNDLNWQDRSDPLNAINTIERKLKDFPYIHTYIVTADHAKSLRSENRWYESAKNADKTITYVASLIAGSTRDSYIEVNVSSDGSTTLQGQKLGE